MPNSIDNDPFSSLNQRKPPSWPPARPVGLASRDIEKAGPRVDIKTKRKTKKGSPQVIIQPDPNGTVVVGLFIVGAQFVLTHAGFFL